MGPEFAIGDLHKEFALMVVLTDEEHERRRNWPRPRLPP